LRRGNPYIKNKGTATPFKKGVAAFLFLVPPGENSASGGICLWSLLIFPPFFYGGKLLAKKAAALQTFYPFVEPQLLLFFYFTPISVSTFFVTSISFLAYATLAFTSTKSNFSCVATFSTIPFIFSIKLSTSLFWAAI
jgi:hypothetical protein